MSETQGQPAAATASGTEIPHRSGCPGPGATIYDYLELGGEWGPFETYTASNDTAATFQQDFEHTFSASQNTMVSPELGLQADKAVAEINAKFGGEATMHAGFSIGDHFTIDVPPHTPITACRGIYIRHYAVTKSLLDGQGNKIEVASGSIDTVKVLTIGVLGHQSAQAVAAATNWARANADGGDQVLLRESLPNFESLPNLYNASGAANWARAHYHHDNPFGFSDDCTDFVSRAMQIGGGLPMFGVPPFENANDRNWYIIQLPFVGWKGTHSWSQAFHLYQFLNLRSLGREIRLETAGPGDLVFVNWGKHRPDGKGDMPPGQKDISGPGGIDHVGMIVGKIQPTTGGDPEDPERVIQIAQHTSDTIETLADWRNANPNMHIWVYSIYYTRPQFTGK